MSNSNDELYDRMLSAVLALVLVSICVLGLIGNGIVLAVGFYKRKYKKNVTNCFIMNLSLTDFLFLLISVPLTSYLGMSKKWIFGNFICKINIYLAYVFLHATCYTLAAMSIDRYLHIVHDQFYRRFRTARAAQFVCLLIWIVSIVFMLPYKHLFKIKSRKHQEENSAQDECTVKENDSSESSCVLTMVFYYILPLLIICLCYLRVSICLKRIGSRMAKRMTALSRQSILTKRKRVQRMLLGLILAFALCWLPIHFLEFLSCTGIGEKYFSPSHDRFWTATRTIAHALSYSNSCLNPILYALLNDRYFSGHR